MNNKLYVGNLTDMITEEDLRDNFGDLGTCLSAHVIRDKQSGRSRGFAFVEMSTPEEARQTVERCRGVMLDGQRLVVKLAQTEQNRQNGAGSRRQR
ncbi:MAG: RNA-binding protein [Deltaproteobacteria bacterium]|nr:RNA-binding protein [Deltaproteobacteria bacterium]